MTDSLEVAYVFEAKFILEVKRHISRRSIPLELTSLSIKSNNRPYELKI